LLLLLPLQTQDNLLPEAKISLHESLAVAFEKLDDTQQAVQHLMQAETIITTRTPAGTQDKVAEVQQKIWHLINKLDQAELVALRGNNTDNDFQGWIDLCLAARNQDFSTSLASWNTSYADHPARLFAKKLTASSAAKAITQSSLRSTGSIALITPLANEDDAKKADALKLGLETAINQYGLANEIKIYSSADNQQDIDEIYTLARNEGNAYFILPSFSAADTNNGIDQTDTNNILHISLPLADEAQAIASFASSHGMQHITVISNNNDTSKLMLNSFQDVWQGKSDTVGNNHALNIIMLPDDMTPTSSSLFELKSQIASKNHDMVLLALPTAEAYLVKPHLDISTPTMAFSTVNEIINNATPQLFNAVRVADMPFLLMADQEKFKDYSSASTDLSTNEQRRWFALGVDSLQLLMIRQQALDNEVSINGLTGTLTVNKAGTLQRRLSLARFTYNGVIAEQ
jgi:outer membrane PBP1 activator LpoA protein